MQTFQFQPPTLEITGGQQQILLENWSSFRVNEEIGGPVFQEYPAGSDQTLSLENGNLRIDLSQPHLYWHFLPWPYYFPHGFMQSWLVQGQWTTAINRLIFWAKPSFNFQHDHEFPLSFGTYEKATSNNDPGWQGNHWYHAINPLWYANRWMKIVLTPKVQASNTQSGNTEFPLINNYFSRMTRWYFGDNETGGNDMPVPSTWRFSPIEFDIVANEPDDLVASICACYSGTRYEVTFAAIKHQLQHYDIAYKTTSMKQAGFASGTFGGTVTNPQSAYTRTHWSGPAMPEANDMYLAIRPQGRSEFTEIYLPKR